MPKPYFRKKEEILDEIVRVDHSGEYGAVRIYKGQIDASSDKDNEILKEMHDGEINHLNFFISQIKQKSYRPSIMLPIWHCAGYAMGFITRKISLEAAMLCTEAVEETIDNHYKEQRLILQNIPNEKLLSSKIEEFRLEELEHKNIAINHGSHNAPMYFLLNNLIKFICKTAIEISKKI